MANFSEFLYQLYAKAMVLFAYFLIELILVVQYLRSETTPTTITTTQYLNFIEEKNPTICYTKQRKILQQVDADHDDDDDDDGVECRVCLSGFEEGDKLRNLKCKHAFHKDCLDKWLQESCATCPICRNKVVADDVVAKYHMFQNHHHQVDFEGNDNQITLLLSSIRGGGTLLRYL